MTQNNDELHKIMAQVQVYASSYSLVGTRFASENQLEEADSEKLALYNIVKSALSQSPISQNEQQPKQIPDGWISVDERLPESIHIEHLTAAHSKAVLGYVKDNLCTFCVSYDYGRKAWRYFDDSHNLVRHEVTHWMPLPTAPTNTEVGE